MILLMENEQQPVRLIAVLNKVSSTRDGGSRITLDCGAESLDAVQKLQRMNADGEVCLAIAIVPFKDDEFI
jgi:hypothetical protein